MPFINSFKSLYDLRVNKAQIVNSIGMLKVSEHDSKASLKFLQINKPGVVLNGFNCSLLKGMPDITEKSSSFFRDLDCDGTVVYQSGNCNTFLFVELKSKFDTAKLYHALNQVLCSFFKFLRMSSICEGFDLDGLNVHFIIACQDFQDAVEKHSATQQVSQLSQLYATNPLYDLLQRVVIDSGKETTRVYDLEKFFLKTAQNSDQKIADIPINTLLKNKKIKLTLKRTANYGDSSASITI